MQQFFQYYGRVQSVRGNLVGLPGWARSILFVLALPGIIALALSIVAVLCSLVALFLLTVPAYGLLRALMNGPSSASAVEQVTAPPTAGRRHVDVKIIE